MTPPTLGLVSPGGRAEKTGKAGPTWNSIGIFVGSVFAFLALAFLLGLGFAVVESRKDIDFLKIRVENLNRDLAYLRGQLDGRKDKP